MSYQFAELVHWTRNKESMILLPAQVDIDLTNICNQDCYYCNSKEFRRIEPVQKKYQEYIALLDRLAGWRAHSPKSYGTTHTITYPGGGEPSILTGFEKVIEHTIDLGFLTSITTNGSHLDKLLDNVVIKKLQKIAWIGIDIDAGSEELYEKIRRSLTKNSLFNRMEANAQELIKAGVNVDFKCLINPLNDNPGALEDLFRFVKRVRGRKLYFRPVIVNGEAHPITYKTLTLIEQLSHKYDQPYWVNQNKIIPRNYKRCHQMYHFPVFCANGKIYVCCEGKGNPQFELGHWDQDDFRDLWMNSRHHEIYNKTNVGLCAPCRPNITNIEIQNILDNPEKIEGLYL
jgi:sulfatase maturation enzyme AslB (radical SAM superfamily)